jgi:5S rRNA maturation endonuclease (ribonuclease M5)
LTVAFREKKKRDKMSFDLLAEMERDGFSHVRKASSCGDQYNGHCILDCGGIGHDRLRVQPNYGAYGRFACTICGCKGSGVDYLMLKRGMAKNDALKAVGWKPKDGSEPHYTIPRHVLNGKIPATHDAPGEKWQSSGRAFTEYCESVLWSDQGIAALEYLHSRGLRDETIKLARIGYNPGELYRPGDRWSVTGKVRLAQGITIPWFIEGGLWRITIRDESVASGDGRYKQVKGGSNGLYLADYLGYRDRPVVVCEGELDALSIAQECGHEVVAVATGTTSGSHTTRWIAELARCERVYIAFDAEDKGDNAATWWLERLGHAQRLRPWWADANQMLQDGVNLLDWLQPCLPPPHIEVEPSLCGVCLDANIETVATHEHEDLMYCAEHAALVPKKTTREAVAQFWKEACPQGWRIEVFTREEWDRKEQKGTIENKPAPKVQTDDRDYWTRTRDYLAKTDFYEQFDAANKRRAEA